MAGQKDDELVIRFMGLYAKLHAKLREWTDDDPAHVIKLADDDEEFRQICSALCWVEFGLRTAERRERRLFTAPVKPEFLETWRDYEERYSDFILDVAFAEIWGGCRVAV